jgi:hypothetical protein
MSFPNTCKKIGQLNQPINIVIYSNSNRKETELNASIQASAAV